MLILILTYPLQTPVGLKNVGQTCWFSALVQSLFNISAVRRLVLTFDLTEHGEQDRVVKEFRELFAFLLGSNRK